MFNKTKLLVLSLFIACAFLVAPALEARVSIGLSFNSFFAPRPAPVYVQPVPVYQPVLVPAAAPVVYVPGYSHRVRHHHYHGYGYGYYARHVQSGYFFY